MRLTIAYSKIKKRNLVLINNDTYRRETLSERPIRQPLSRPALASDSQALKTNKNQYLKGIINLNNSDLCRLLA